MKKPASSLELSLHASLICRDETAAAIRFVGVGATTVTLAVPPTLPLAARTVAGPALPGAVYRPVGLTVPPPARTDQAKAGCVARAAPNWSFAVAENGWAAPAVSVAVAGLT